jgi:hypothetical protein
MVRGSKFKAFVDVQDAQAKKSETLVSWKLDDGEWSEWVPASELTSIEINSLAKGEHILHIRERIALPTEHWHGGSRAALDGEQDVLRVPDAVWRPAQHECVPHLLRDARHAARAQQKSR